MKVQLSGRVHSCEAGSFPAVALVGGREVAATVQGVIVEVVGDSRSFTIDLAGQDLAEAKAGFAPGTSILLTVETV